MLFGLNKEQFKSKIFTVYCVAVLIQNILAVKNIDVLMFSVTTGILVSPIVFTMQDVSSELYGFKETKKMIIFAYFMNLLMIIFTSLAMIIPKAEYYQNQEAFEAIFGTTPRIVVSSFIAYMTGSIINSKIMTSMKKRNNLFIRAITSTLVGQLLDNFVFCYLAFIGVLSLQQILSMTIGATIVEVLYEIIIYPIVKKIINKY